MNGLPPAGRACSSWPRRSLPTTTTAPPRSWPTSRSRSPRRSTTVVVTPARAGVACPRVVGGRRGPPVPVLPAPMGGPRAGRDPGEPAQPAEPLAAGAVPVPGRSARRAPGGARRSRRTSSTCTGSSRRALMALLGARRSPWLVTTQGGDLYALTSSVARWVKRRVLRRARAVTVMNTEMGERVVALGVPAERVRVLSMGVALDRMPAPGPGAGPRPVDLRRPAGGEEGAGAPAGGPARPPGGPRVVAGGRRGRAAAGRARGSGRHRWGTGWSSSGSARRRTSVTGWSARRSRCSRRCGPARATRTACPSSLLEALATGTPVVASDLPGLADAVSGGGDPAGHRRRARGRRRAHRRGRPTARRRRRARPHGPGRAGPRHRVLGRRRRRPVRRSAPQRSRASRHAHGLASAARRVAVSQ